MKTVEVRNAHQALPEVCYQLRLNHSVEPSRNGDVLRMNEPLTVCYRRPEERVIFHPERDANPFFHLFEALWMISGRNDVEFVQQFAGNMANYSDDGETFHGAYGYRWRKHFGFDQINVLVENLRREPNCRRQVLTMWDPRADLGHVGKDLPCNTQIYFQKGTDNRLDMMVTNRSNDLIWGALGSNVVHFSFLQEYIAGMLEVPLGRYWQTTFNPHIYVQPHGELMERMAELAPSMHVKGVRHCPYSEEAQVHSVKMQSIPWGRWHRELSTFMVSGSAEGLADPFFANVVGPMMEAWKFFKSGTSDRFIAAQLALGEMLNCDWQRACWEWIERRRLKHVSR